MTSRELLYVKTIADEKSITKAAQKLYLTQPSLSHCVASIEKQLGTRLFRRTTSGLVLTYAGENTTAWPARCCAYTPHLNPKSARKASLSAAA